MLRSQWQMILLIRTVLMSQSRLAENIEYSKLLRFSELKEADYLSIDIETVTLPLHPNERMFATMAVVRRKDKTGNSSRPPQFTAFYETRRACRIGRPVETSQRHRHETSNLSRLSQNHPIPRDRSQGNPLPKAPHQRNNPAPLLPLNKLRNQPSQPKCRFPTKPSRRYATGPIHQSFSYDSPTNGRKNQGASPGFRPAVISNRLTTPIEHSGQNQQANEIPLSSSKRLRPAQWPRSNRSASPRLT